MIPYRNLLQNNFKNLIGKSLKQKYIIFESDDWGSIRMPNKKTFESLEKSGVKFGNTESLRYNKYDTLANVQDFDCLFTTLQKFKDTAGNHPIITAVSVVANPDFEKIKENNFSKYFFESFHTTLHRYNQENAIEYWKRGIDEKLFVPEFHGREHLNVNVWLRDLQKKKKETITAFDHQCWGIPVKTPSNISYQAAFDVEFEEDIKDQEQIIASGLELFNTLHNYKAKVFVPPNGPFNNSLAKISKTSGIDYISTSKIQSEPLGLGKHRKVIHWLGQKNKYNQIYLTRNAFFEPSSPHKDWVDSCLNDIHYAFKWNKPAVISTHRVNYIGAIDENNRKSGLDQLSILISRILKKWPDVRFITSAELGNKLQNGE
ncbi:polysaccharide (de)acetylase [Mesonia sp.]|uniref:polysaccharide (de)acetylase n=1 Tax=Mesonia sp. TaxID=1960830 RepID=UPI00176E8144|nr:polysaccharide (de)acetylase [Mesonia sp.]HIB38463.1 polysaccharide (de)acetylase [Mesonia sp.]